MIPTEIAKELAFAILMLLNERVMRLRLRESWLSKQELHSRLRASERKIQSTISSLLINRLAEVEGTYFEEFQIRRCLSRKAEAIQGKSPLNPRQALVDADMEVLADARERWKVDYDISLRRNQRTHTHMLGSRIASVERAIDETRGGRIDLPEGESAAYDVFISYRRSTGGEAARLVMAVLEPEYRVFLDVERPECGYFEKTILDAIEKSRNFVVILSQHCFEQTHEESDWFRQEIEQAIRIGINIVPIRLTGFTVSNQEDSDEIVDAVVRHEAVEWDHRYFDAMVQKLKTLLHY